MIFVFSARSIHKYIIFCTTNELPEDSILTDRDTSLRDT
jgi:hypothetical protein